MRSSPSSDRNIPESRQPWSELGPLQPNMSDSRTAGLIVALIIDGMWRFAELLPPARFQVLSPDYKIEPAFQNGIARVFGGSSNPGCAKGAVSLCCQMSFDSSACRLDIENVEAALFLSTGFPFLNRYNVVPRGHARGHAGCEPC